MSLLNFIKEHLDEGFLPLHVSYEAMKRYGCTLREIEMLSLEEGIVPLRFKRNLNTLSAEDQKTLFYAHVAIIGCGGLGGHVAELLARTGVGTLSLHDGDTFEEHNLNRQLGATLETLGHNKALCLAKRVESINPALHVIPTPSFLELPKDEALLTHVDLIVDALDNPTLKTTLSHYALEHNKGFVHGAIAGLNIQCVSNRALDHLYHSEGLGAEHLAGNLSFTVACAAALQANEAIKILLKRPHLEKILFADLAEYEFSLL